MYDLLNKRVAEGFVSYPDYFSAEITFMSCFCIYLWFKVGRAARKKSNFAIFETLYDLRKKLNHRQPALPSPWISLKVQLWRNLRTLYDGCQLNFWNSRSDFRFFLIQRLTSIYNYRTSSYSFRPWIVSAHLCTEVKGHST